MAETNFSRIDIIKTFDLNGKLFTEKLFLRAATLIDESITYLEDMVKPAKMKEIRLPKTREEFAITSASCVSQRINQAIYKKNNIDQIFIDNDLNSEFFILVVTFTYFCTIAISSLLKDEEMNINGDELIQAVLAQFVDLEESTKKTKLIKEGHLLFNELINSKHENVLNWFNNLLNAIYTYVMSFDVKNASINDENVIEIIVGLFEKLVSAYSRDIT